MDYFHGSEYSGDLPQLGTAAPDAQPNTRIQPPPPQAHQMLHQQQDLPLSYGDNPYGEPMLMAAAASAPAPRRGAAAKASAAGGSGYRGVTYVASHEQRWKATINQGGRPIDIGYFETEDEAAYVSSLR